MSNFSLNLRTGFLISNYLLTGLALNCLILSDFFSVLTVGILIAGLIYCYALECRATIPDTPSKNFPSSIWGLLLAISLYLGFGLPITPPDPTQAALPKPKPLTRTLYLLRMNWQHYIIRYSVNDQAEMIQFFRSGGCDAMDSLKNLTSLKWKEWIAKQRWVLLILLIIVGCIFLLRKCGFSPPSSQAVLLYEKLKKYLEKNGIKIKFHWTAWELLHSGIPDQKFKQVEREIDYYEKVRFGNKPAYTNIEKEIRETLSSI